MKNALQLLILITEKLSPPPGRSHSLTVLNGVLVLTLARTNGGFQPVYFGTDGDLDRDPAAVIADIVALLASQGDS